MTDVLANALMPGDLITYKNRKRSTVVRVHTLHRKTKTIQIEARDQHGFWIGSIPDTERVKLVKAARLAPTQGSD